MNLPEVSSDYSAGAASAHHDAPTDNESRIQVAP